MILLRSLLFNIYFFGVTFLLSIVGTIVRLIAPHRVLVIPRFWARAALAGLRVICAIRLEVIGREQLPTSGAALIAPRHQSAFDTLVWLTLLPRCCYVIKRELKHIPLFGGMMEPAGMILVDRKRGVSAMSHLMREADRAVHERRQIVIFPEGTRAAPGAPLVLQPGISAVAARTKLSVIPVITDSGLHWGRRAFRKLPGTIHIAVLPAIAASADRDSFMRHLERALQTPLRSPCGQICESSARALRSEVQTTKATD